ncbi:MAG: hypothetical protein ACLFVU_01830 [Phycisphaerae bacterium]
MNTLWAISKNTFTQTIRQPIFAVLLAVTFVVLVIDLPLSNWTMGTAGGDYHKTDQQMLVNLGMSTLLVSGLLVSAFSASSVLSKEIRERTVLTVIAKPVGRVTFLGGKFLGVATAVLLAFYLCTLVFLMTVRHKVVPAASDPIDWPVIIIGVSCAAAALIIALAGNFFFGWNFVSGLVYNLLIFLTLAMLVIAFVGKGWKIVPFGQGIDSQILLGVALIFMAVLVFTAVAVAASTRFGQVMTLLVCAGAFFLGSMHPFLFNQESRDIFVVKALSWLVVKLTFFYPLDALTMEKTIPGTVVLLAGLYCLLYVIAVLSVGVIAFQHRELAGGTTDSSLPALVGLVAWAGRAASVAAVLVALVMVSLPVYRNAAGIGVIVGLIVAGVLTWIFWGYFGRGKKWSYYLVVAVVALLALRNVAALLIPGAHEALPVFQDSAKLVLELVLEAAVLLVLLLPGSRRHFASATA